MRILKKIPANMGCLTNVVLMLAHRLRRWPNIETASVKRPVFSWDTYDIMVFQKYIRCFKAGSLHDKIDVERRRVFNNLLYRGTQTSILTNRVSYMPLK